MNARDEGAIAEMRGMNEGNEARQCKLRLLEGRAGRHPPYQLATVLKASAGRRGLQRSVPCLLAYIVTPDPGTPQ